MTTYLNDYIPGARRALNSMQFGMNWEIDDETLLKLAKGPKPLKALPRNTLDQLVNHILQRDGKYFDIEPSSRVDVKEGAQRAAYIAKRGTLQSFEEVFVRVDKEPTSDVAKDLAEKGNGTLREIKQLQSLDMVEAKNNRVLPLYDFYKVDNEWISVVPLVKDRNEPAKNLRQWVNEYGPLSRGDYSSVIRDVLTAASFLHKKGINHRDWTPDNIVLQVDEKTGRLRAWATDFATAANENEAQAGTDVTGGGRSTRDFKLNAKFTGNPSIYDSTSERYSLAQIAAFAARGHVPVSYDFKKHTGTDFKGKSTLNADGTINPDLHSRGIQEAFEYAPDWVKKHAKWINRATTAIQSKKKGRYLDDQAMIHDFEKACKPSMLERAANNWKKLALYGLLGAGLIASAPYGIEQIKESQRYKVTTEWNWDKMQVENNFIGIQATAGIEGGRTDDKFPNKTFIKIKPGETLQVDPSLYSKISQELARKKGMPKAHGRVYIDGLTDIIPAREFSYYPDFKDAPVYSEGGSYPTIVNLKMPTNGVPEGVYKLKIEVFKPDLQQGSNEYERETTTKHLSKTSYKKAPQGVIASVSVPIIYGEPSGRFSLSSVYFPSSEDFTTKSFSSRDFSYESGLTNWIPREKFPLELHLPDENWSLKANAGSYDPNLPRKSSKPNQPQTLHIVYRNGNRVVGYESLPVTFSERKPSILERLHDKIPIKVRFKLGMDLNEHPTVTGWKVIPSSMDAPDNSYTFLRNYNSGNTANKPVNEGRK